MNERTNEDKHDLKRSNPGEYEYTCFLFFKWTLFWRKTIFLQNPIFHINFKNQKKKEKSKFTNISPLSQVSFPFFSQKKRWVGVQSKFFPFYRFTSPHRSFFANSTFSISNVKKAIKNIWNPAKLLFTHSKKTDVVSLLSISRIFTSFFLPRRNIHFFGIRLFDPFCKKPPRMGWMVFIFFLQFFLYQKFLYSSCHSLQFWSESGFFYFGSKAGDVQLYWTS